MGAGVRSSGVPRSAEGWARRVRPSMGEAVSSTLVALGDLAELGLLAAEASHEINNTIFPVWAIVTQLADMLRSSETRSKMEPKVLEVIDTIVTDLGLSFEQIKDLNGMLTLDSRGSDSDRLGAASTDLRDTIRTIERLIRLRSFGRAKVEFDIGQVPAIAVHSQKLGRLILNLVVNAIDAFPEPDRERNRVSIRATRSRGHVILEISDNGPGVDPQIQERLLEPFFTTKPAGQGTGLGLTICAHIVERYSGVMEFRSRPGGGTTVAVRLPVLPSSLWG